MAEKKRPAFGKGISALIANMDTELEHDAQAVVETLAQAVAMLPLSQIEVNPWQPRQDFETEALEDLVASIKEHGIIQPLTVRRLEQNRYQLIAGGRRFKAAGLAGLQEVPAYVRVANDQQMLEMALVENIQRADLNPMEIAFSYHRLAEEFQITHEALGERVGKSRSAVTNFMRLLKLPPEIQSGLKAGKLSMGHARALLGVEDLALQLSLYREVMNNDLNVRQTEALLQRHKSVAPAKPAPASTRVSTAVQTVQNQLQGYLGAKVMLKEKPKGGGQIQITYNNPDDLQRILELIEKDNAG